MLTCGPMDRRWLLGGLLLAGGYGFVRAVTYRPRLSDDSRVMLLGDSLAQGMLPHFRALAEESGLAFVGAGIPGTRVDQWENSDWLVKKLKELSPTHVLISLGTNDAFSGKSPEAVAASAQRLLDKLAPYNAHAIWIGAPVLPAVGLDGKTPINTEVLEAIRAVAPYYFDSAMYEIPRGPDGLHPTAGGYGGWAGSIWNWLT